MDTLGGRIYRDRVDDDGALVAVGAYELPGTVGMIVPVQGDDGWLLGVASGFVHLAYDGTQRLVAEVTRAGTRVNDGACDPQGRCWAGTLADDHRHGGGALYRLDRDGRVELVLDGLTVPSGVAWSPDGDTMYLVDSARGVVLTFAFDGDDGRLSAGRILITVAEAVGAPDGMTVDAAGDLWVAINGGGRVHRYTPDGDLREVLTVPAQQSTCCAFGGPGLHALYVTTETRSTEGEHRVEPAAGLVYRIDTTATGRPAAPYVPDTEWWGTVTRRIT